MSLKSKSIVTLMMILISAFTFTSLFYYTPPYNPLNLLPPVAAAGPLTLNPTSAHVGSTVTVTGTLLGTDTSCALSGTAVASSSCSISSGSVTASFVVANVVPGPYTITATGSPGSDTDVATLTVLGPSIVLLPVLGQPGTTVSVTGTGFFTTDTTCALTGGAVSTQSCSVSGGALTGSFTVANVAVGPYTITAPGTPGSDFGTANFQITTAAPSITLSPTSAQVGGTVHVSGSGFSSGDTACSLAGAGSIATFTCSVSSGILTASFVIGNTAPGSYTITALGTPGGDTAQATLVVLAPSLILSPSISQVGVTIHVSGTGFYTPDTCTAFTGTPVGTNSCTISGGVLTGSFVVASGTAVGSYPITETPSGGDVATATFQVTAATVAIVLTPSSAQVGSTVAVSGSGFSTGDITCTLTDGGAIASYTCSVSNGILTGSILVANQPLGPYTITANGSPGGETPQATLTILAPTITLNPSSAQAGTSVAVSGSGFYTSSATCSIAASAAIATSTCSITGGHVTASFVVSSTAAIGTYPISVSGSGDPDAAIANFQVTPITPTISLNPSSAHFGATVQVTGLGFNQADSSCTLSGGGVISTSSCTISGGVVTASFVVSNTAMPGTFTINVNGSPNSDSGAATFTLLGPSITLNPTSAAIGATISVSGIGFITTDTSCALSDGGVIATSTCSVSAGILTGTFVVASVVVGSYTITAIGSPGTDFATANFQLITPTPHITLTPSSALVGATVSVSGSGFSTGDAACTLTSTPSGAFATSSCSVSGGILTASFVIANVAPMPYTISESLLTASDPATATLTVLAPTLVLTPSSGQNGKTISISGSGFFTTDTSCTITGGSAVTSPACSISGGTITGSFVIGPAPLAVGPYTITVTGNPGPDLATATLQVTATATLITLTPSSAQVGATVHVTGSGFSTADTTCAITGGATVTSQTCSISGGTITGSFVVGNVATGPYTIQAKGTPGSDLATTSLTVLSPTLVLNPSQGQYGTTIQISGSGFFTTDTSCTITGGSAVTSPACSISGGTITGSFVIGPAPLAVGPYTITVTGNPGPDLATATLQVTASSPSITVSPISAGVGATVQVTGLGFSMSDTTCVLTGSLSVIQSGSPVCSISAGKLTGSFIVGNVAANPYTITATAHPGGEPPMTIFNVLGPTINLTPNSGIIGSTVLVSGSNFALSDTSCAFSGTMITSSSTCSISSGKLTGSFVISNANSPGSTTVTATGNVALDSNSPATPFLITTNAATILLTPSSAQAASIVSFTGSGFLTTDTSCTPTGTGVTLPTCTISGGHVSGTFTVGNVAAGIYTITVTGNPSLDAGTALLQVLGPTLTLSPTSAPQGTAILVTGSGFYTTDTTCALTPSSVIALSPASTCAISNGKVTGIFTVASVPSSVLYTITATGTPSGKSASAQILVTASAPKITLTPASGPTGIIVSITASGFAPADALTGLSFASSPSGLWSVAPTGCGSLTNGGCVASFTVTGISGTGYTVTATGNSAGDFASAAFVVSSTSNSLTLSPASGPSGSLVTFSGIVDVTTPGTPSGCSVGTGNGNGLSTQSTSCVLVGTTSFGTTFSGSFVVGNVAPGTYSVRVTVNGGTVASGQNNYADATFIVTGAQITLTPNSGRTGISVTVSGSGFSFADNTCSLSSPSNGGVILNGACSITGGTGVASASFTVGNINPGTYLIQVQGSTGDTAQASFTVTTGASITLNPSSGGVGVTVSVSGSGFRTDDSSCSISGTGVQNPACSISVGTGTPSGSFVVSNVSPGSYVITLNGNNGDSAQATFTVTSGASITLNPASGGVGVTVTVTGAGFRTDDSSCSINGSPVQNPSCTISIGTGTPSGSFVVSNISPGSYTITLNGNNGDSAQASFTVTTGASITLNPSSGGVGQTVTVTGSGFRTDDSSCSISGTGVQNPACTISVGSGTPLGSFVVSNVNPGSYVITLNGNNGDSAQASFTVVSGATIVLKPTAGGVGITVTVTGSGFRTDDSSCTISGSNGVVTGSACSINLGTGTVSGSFIVASVSPGAYTITVSGNNGDSATATFTVTTGPSIVLSPSTGTVGVTVIVTGSGFLPADTSCSLSGSVVSGSSCIITAGSGAPTGIFTVGGVGAGSYTVTLSGSGGDSAQASFVVTVTTPVLTLFPSSSVAPGTTVTFTATGLLAPDTGCTLTATPSTIILSSPTCTINGAHVATGSFVVSASATADKNPWGIQVVGSPGNDMVPVSPAPLTVIPEITVTPASGTIGTQFSFTGEGFSSAAVSCTVTFSLGTWTSQTCGVSSNGQVSGSFISTTSAPGNYPVLVQDNTGLSAGSFAVIGAPTAQVTISPNVVSPGQVVQLSGSGFNAGDSTCTIAPSSIYSSPVCSIAGGVLSGSFTVSTSSSGLYLMTVTGNSGDFASNYLEVAILTGTMTTSTSTTVSVTTTTATSITTTMPVTLTTTSITFTGPSTSTFFTLTTTSVTGQSTASISTTTATTTTIIISTATTTSQTVTGIYTIGGGVSTLAGMIGQSSSTSPTINGDMVGLISVLALLGFAVFRRWAF